MRKKHRLSLIYLLVLVDVVVGAVITPVMPQFVKNRTQPELWLSGATALFLGLQLFSGPLLGKLADDIGRRPILIVSTLGTLLANGFLIPIKAGWLLVNRLSDGMTNGMFAAVRSAITDVSPKEDLVKNLGIQGTIVSLGNVLGPMIAGGLLTVFTIAPNQQTQYVIYIGIGLSIINVIISLLIRESCPEPSGFEWRKVQQTVQEAINPKLLWQQLQQKEEQKPGLRTLVLVRIALALTQGYYTYFVTYLALSPLRYDTKEISYFFIYYGGLSVVSSFIFYRYIADRLNQHRAVFWFALIGVPVIAGYGFVGKTDSLLYGLITIDCLSIGLISGMVEGLIAKHSDEAERGELFGLVQGLQGFASLLTTLLFGVLSVVDLRLPFIWFMLTLVAVTWLAFQAYRQTKTITS